MRRGALPAALLISSAALAQAPSPERAVVPLEPAEREFVLREMRDFLVMLEQLSAGLARGDFDAIAADAARRDLQYSLGQAGRLLATCNACHAAYRFAN